MPRVRIGVVVRHVREMTMAFRARPSRSSTSATSRSGRKRHQGELAQHFLQKGSCTPSECRVRAGSSSPPAEVRSPAALRRPAMAERRCEIVRVRRRQPLRDARPNSTTRRPARRSGSSQARAARAGVDVARVRDQRLREAELRRTSTRPAALVTSEGLACPVEHAGDRRRPHRAPGFTGSSTPRARGSPLARDRPRPPEAPGLAADPRPPGEAHRADRLARAAPPGPAIP